jgi:hypothetical protein
MVEFEMSLTLLTFSGISMYRLRKFPVPPFSDSDNWEFSGEYSKSFMTLGPGMLSHNDEKKQRIACQGQMSGL